MTFRRRRYHRRPRVTARINRHHPLASGLVGCWLFNEGAGSLVHDACGNNHGTITGGLGSTVLWTDDPGLTGEPSAGLGLNFSSDASTNRVDLGSIMASNPLSLSGLTKATFAFGCTLPNDALTTNAFPRILDKSNAGTGSNGFSMWVGSPGTRVSFARAGTSVESIDIPGAIVVESGYSDTVVWRDGDSAGFSRDGALQQTRTGLGATAFATTTTNAAIGNWNHSTDRAFYGTLYYLFVWSRKIPQESIGALARDPYLFLTAPRNFAMWTAIRELVGVVSGKTAETAWETPAATIGKSQQVATAAAESAWEGPGASLNKHKLIGAASAETAWSGEIAQLSVPLLANSADTVWEQEAAALNKHALVTAASAETAWDADSATVAKNTGIAAAAGLSAWEPLRQGLWPIVNVAMESPTATISKRTMISAAVSESAWTTFGIGFATVLTAWETASATLGKSTLVSAGVGETAWATSDAGVGYLLHWLTSSAALNKHTLIAADSADVAVEALVGMANSHVGILANEAEVAFEIYAVGVNKHTLVASGPVEIAREAYDAVIDVNILSGTAESAFTALVAAFNKHLSFTTGTTETALTPHPAGLNKAKLIAGGTVDAALETGAAFVAPNISAASAEIATETFAATFVRDEVNTQWQLGENRLHWSFIHVGD